MTGGIRGPGLGGSGGDRMTSGTSGVSIMPGHYFVFRYTVNLYNGRRSSSADPVPAYESGARVLDDRLELAAAGLDHGPGPGVVLVADHEDPVDAVGPRDHEALPEYLGRIAATPVPGNNGVANVTAFPREKVVEGEADGRPADYLSPDVGDQEGPGNLPGRPAGPHPVIMQRGQVGVPGHSRLEAQAEVEAFLGQRIACRPERHLVIGPGRPEPERRVQRAVIGGIGQHRLTLATAARLNQSLTRVPKEQASQNAGCQLT
jgi:hypothetical protein